MANIVVAALYKFVSLPDFEKIQPKLKALCLRKKIMGTLLLAKEGINGTVAGSREAIDALLDFFKADSRLHDLEYKESFAEEMPFYRMKVRLKKEIVTIGDQSIDPNSLKGEYVDPEDWNDLINDPEVIVLDTRNDYEVDIGTFKGAINPETDSFREFPDYVKSNLDPHKHKKVAMFCTGGIRCEKASAYMKNEGFENVYHLKGGILKYLEDVPQEHSHWEGECFVFDNRVAVTHGLEQGNFDQCYGCRHPISMDEKKSPHYIKGVQCPKCYDKLTSEKKEKFVTRQKQVEHAKKLGTKHIGMVV